MSQSETERLRHAILDYLVQRRPLAFDSESISRLLCVNQMIDFKTNQTECFRELQLLKDFALVDEIHDPLGSTHFYRANGKGILECERMRVP